MNKLLSLNDEYKKLIETQQKEQVYQEFLEKNSRLIPREFVQNHGIHLDLALRKLSLAKDYTTDFFYLAKSSADWNCVLIEIEKPYSKFFQDGTNQIHQDFINGLDQINRWRAWFMNRSNYDGFINGTIKSLRTPAPLSSNPCNIKYVLVTGRRNELENNDIRRNLIVAYERDDFHILTYDSLIESLHSKSNVYVGIKKNEFIEIHSEVFSGEMLFSVLEPEQLRINENLRTDIGNNRQDWFHFTSKIPPNYVLDEKLPKIKNI